MATVSSGTGTDVEALSVCRLTRVTLVDDVVPLSTYRVAPSAPAKSPFTGAPSGTVAVSTPEEPFRISTAPVVAVARPTARSPDGDCARTRADDDSGRIASIVPVDRSSSCKVVAPPLRARSHIDPLTCGAPPATSPAGARRICAGLGPAGGCGREVGDALDVHDASSAAHDAPSAQTPARRAAAARSKLLSRRLWSGRRSTLPTARSHEHRAAGQHEEAGDAALEEEGLPGLHRGGARQCGARWRHDLDRRVAADREGGRAGL